MRKNILLFGHSYATQFIDISNQYTQLFDPAKYHVTVAYLVGEPDEAIRQQHTAEEVIFLNFSRKSIGGLKITAIKKMLQLCREKQFEIVVCQRYKPIYIMMWVAQFISIPALFFVMHELGTLSAVSRKLLIASLIKKNMVFAGVSNAVRDDLRAHIWNVPAERVITLYNMIDAEWTEKELLNREAARAALNLDINTFLFGNIGRLAINKDQTTLLKAFAQIKPNCPNSKLIIMGDGSLEKSLKQEAHDLNIHNDVIFTGFVPQSFRYIPAFDVLISASIQEAFGRVLLEAMIAKAPIIATSVNGVPEVIGDAGVLISANDVDQLAKEMLNAFQLSTTERNTWGLKGYQRAIDYFSSPCFHKIFWNLDLLQEKLI